MTSIGTDCIHGHGRTLDYKGCGQDAQTEHCRSAMAEVRNRRIPGFALLVFTSAIWPLTSTITLLQSRHVRSTSTSAALTSTRAHHRISDRRRIRNGQAQPSARWNCPDLHCCRRCDRGNLRFQSTAETPGRGPIDFVVAAEVPGQNKILIAITLTLRNT